MTQKDNILKYLNNILFIYLFIYLFLLYKGVYKCIALV